MIHAYVYKHRTQHLLSNNETRPPRWKDRTEVVIVYQRDLDTDTQAFSSQGPSSCILCYYKIYIRIELHPCYKKMLDNGWYQVMMVRMLSRKLSSISDITLKWL